MKIQSVPTSLGLSSSRVTRSKNRMISVFLSVTYCTVLGAWFIFFFLKPLNEEARSMHTQQLDPTQIIAIPYNLQRLCTFVIAVLVSAIFIDVQSIRMHIFYKIQRILHLSVIFFLVFLLCGASLYVDLLHTYLAALYLVTLSWFDPPIFYHTSMVETLNLSRRTSSSPLTGKSWVHPIYFDAILQLLRGPPSLAPGKPSLELRQQFILSQTIVYCCWIGSIPTQVLLLYDRGYQVQRYPIPVILGCTIGWTIGMLCGTIRAFSFDGRPPQ